jgi:hypothetical protein
MIASGWPFRLARTSYASCKDEKMKMEGYLLSFWWNGVGLLDSEGLLEGSLGFASEEEC